MRSPAPIRAACATAAEGVIGFTCPEEGQARTLAAAGWPLQGIPMWHVAGLAGWVEPFDDIQERSISRPCSIPAAVRPHLKRGQHDRRPHFRGWRCAS